MPNKFTEFLDSDPDYRHNWNLFLLDIIEDEVSEEQRWRDYSKGLNDKQMAARWA